MKARRLLPLLAVAAGILLLSAIARRAKGPFPAAQGPSPGADGGIPVPQSVALPTPGATAPLSPAPSPENGKHLWLVSATCAHPLPAGVEMVGYRSDDNTFLLAADARGHEALLRSPCGPSLRPFPAKAKISPVLDDRLQSDGCAGARITVVAATGDTNNVPRLREALAAVGATDIRLSASSPRHVLATANLPPDTDAAQSAIAALADSPTIQWLEPAPARILLNDCAQTSNHLASAALRPALGLTGSNQLVAVADTGLDSGVLDMLHPDLAGRVADAIALARTNDWSDPDGHGTHVTGSILGTGAMSGGQYAGVAPAAQVYFQSIGNAAGSLVGIPDDLYDLFLPEYDAGARISSHSWGSALASTYDVDALAVDEFTYDHPDFLLLFAAGNQGETVEGGRFRPASIDSPATAKNSLAIGASESGREPGTGGRTAQTYREAWKFADEPVASDLVSSSPSNAPGPQGLAAFSSRGPTDDHRTKPDLVAPGTDIISLRSRLADTNHAEFVLAGNTNYVFESGTSMSTPLVAGCAVLLREHLCAKYGVVAPAAALLRATLIGGARSLYPGQYPLGWAQELPGPPRPNNAEGWGQPALLSTLAPPSPSTAFFLDAPLEPFASALDAPHAYTVEVARADAPLAVALAYADAPPALSSRKRLVNDLDLSLRAPDGTTYHPSLAPGPDRTNVVETIDLPAPLPCTGLWTVVVAPYAVPVPPQSYALYLRGPLAPSRPAFVHAALPDTSVTDAPYPVDTAFSPPFLATNRVLSLQYIADRPDATVDAATVPMTTSNRVAFAAAIPPQPLGTTVAYTFSATGNASDLPPFPTYTFRVVPPVSVAIAVEPPLLADAFPDLFPAAPIPLASGAVYTATAPLDLDDPDSPSLCRYHLASPSAATAITVTATAPTTLVTFAYTRQTSLLQLSSPPGLLHTTTWHTVAPAPAPTFATSASPPLLATLGSTNYAFSGWLLDDAPLPAPAAIPLTNLDLAAPRTLVAQYLPADRDADANHLADAFELRHFGALGQSPYDDPDADGYPNALEDADATDPLDPASVPTPPTISLAPIPSPVTNAFPLPVAAIATDNAAVASVVLTYTRIPAASPSSPLVRNLQMLPAANDLSDGMDEAYAALVPLPAVDSDHFTLSATATDAAGLATTTPPLDLDLAYPALPPAQFPTNPIAVALPYGNPPHTILLTLTNAGTAPLHLAASFVPVGYSNDCETASSPAAPTPTPGSTWHLDALAAHSPTSAWYNGYGAYNPTYPASSDTTLQLPPVRLYPTLPATLAFQHLADFEPDVDSDFEPGTLPHYWDSAILEYTSDADPAAPTATWHPLVPEGGYPALVTSNAASPFPPDTPCLASTSGRWQAVSAPLPPPSSLSRTGAPVHLRFHFGADAFVCGRGWHIDDILVTPRTAHAPPAASNNWCALSPASLDIPPAATATLALTFDPALVPPGTTDYQLLALAHTDPTRPSPLYLPLQLADTTTALSTTAEGPGAVTPDCPPGAPLLIPPDALPTNILITFAPTADPPSLLADLQENGIPVPTLPDGPLALAITAPTNLHLHATFAPTPPSGAIPPADWFEASGIPTNSRPLAALAALDPDHDALRTWQEYALALDPLVPDAKLLLLSPPPLLTWHAFTNETATYILEATTNLATTPFAPVLTLPASPPFMTHSVTASPPAFYRLRLD